MSDEAGVSLASRLPGHPAGGDPKAPARRGDRPAAGADRAEGGRCGCGVPRRASTRSPSWPTTSTTLRGAPGTQGHPLCSFTDWGSHDDAGDAREGALSRSPPIVLRALADEIGLPIIPIDSNVMEAYRGTGLNYQQTHTPRGASVAFLLQQGVGRWLYASALHLRHTRVDKHYDTTLTDPVALPLLSTSSLLLESHGGQYTRFDKTMRIAEDPRHLLVARRVRQRRAWGLTVRNASSASGRWPTLEIGGVLDRYVDVFDLDVYQRHRDTYFALAPLSRDPLVKELLVEARSRGFALPRPSLRRVSPTFYRHAKSEAIRHRERLLKRLGATE